MLHSIDNQSFWALTVSWRFDVYTHVTPHTGCECLRRDGLTTWSNRCVWGEVRSGSLSESVCVYLSCPCSAVMHCELTHLDTNLTLLWDQYQSTKAWWALFWCSFRPVTGKRLLTSCIDKSRVYETGKFLLCSVPVCFFPLCLKRADRESME